MRHAVPMSVPLVASAVALLLAGCASTWPFHGSAKGEPPPLPKMQPIPSQPRALVRRLPDGTLEVVTLVSERGSGAHGVRLVRPGHPDYPALSALVEGIRQGDARRVSVDAGR